MSRENLTDILDFDKICQKIISYLNLSTQNDLAKHFGMGKQAFSNKKQRGTLLNYFVRFGIENDVDLNWLLLDKGNINSVKTDSRFHDIEKRLNDIESNLYNDRGINKKGNAA